MSSATLLGARRRASIYAALKAVDREQDSGLFLPPIAPPKPVPKPFDPTTATRLEVGTDVAAALERGRVDEQFLLEAGHWKSWEDVQPKAGQYVRGSDPSNPAATFLDGAGKFYFVRGHSTLGKGVHLGGFFAKGFGKGTNDNGFAAIQSEHNAWSKETADEWLIHDVELESCGTSGVGFGNHWQILRVRADDHARTGFHSGGVVGGVLWEASAKGNGWNSGAGALVDGAQVKVAWINGIKYRIDRVPSAYRPPEAVFSIVGGDFDGTLYPGRNSNNPMRGIWFDLDCRMCLVVGGEVRDASFAVFVEGCNGVDTVGLTAIRCGGKFWRWDWDWPSGALYAGDSTNVDFIDCTTIDCDAPMITKLGNRRDWFVDFPVAIAENVPVAGARADSRWPTGLGEWLTPTLLPIPTRAEQSNVGTGNVRFIRTKVIGDSNHVGASESLEPKPNTPNVKGKTPWDTLEWIDNDYSEVDGGAGSINFHWQHQDLLADQWAEIGHDLSLAA